MAALAQDVASIQSGVPLRVALEHRVAIKHTGEPLRGRLVDPIYVYDRLALPAGSLVEGHIAEIGGVPVRRRLTAILSGNFTPPRDVRAQFDTLVVADGSRLSLHASLSRGTAHTLRIAKQNKKQAGPAGAPDRPEDTNQAAIRAFQPPGRMSQLKSTLFGMLPYHRQAWPVGTLFNTVLEAPLAAPAPGSVEARGAGPAAAGPEAQELYARLLTPISSATARRGAPVEAAVTRPLFSADHRLLIPEGSRLLGDVVEARPARYLHRNGKVLFVFHRIRLASGTVQSIQGYLEGVEADSDAHLALDSEGATRASSPKSRFIFPAIAVAVAGLSLHQDYNAQGVPDQDIAGRAESGAVGLGLIGTVLAQTSRTLASGIAFTGAGFSVYTNFIARGQDVVLPVNTPVKVSVRARGGDEPLKRGL
ncbi:MAG: hypothetical protein NTY38_14410 [Acidobacteria bacterium]|nr:hypothetical protein [Acidobacteriota bacterium]